MDYVMAITSVILLSGNFVFQKLYSLKASDSSCNFSVVKTLQYSLVTGVISLLFLLTINGFHLQFSAFSLTMAALSCILCTSYTLIGFYIITKAQMALYTFFLMAGGMTVPYIWGLIFLGEPVVAARVIGLILIVVALLLSGSGQMKTSGKLIALCVVVFVLNGFVSVVSKEHQISVQAVDTVDYSILGGIAGIVINTILMMLFKQKNHEAPHISYKLLPIMVGAAVINCGSSLLMLICAKTLPASALYPIITGGSVIFTSLAGLLFFHEKPPKKQYIAIALCFIGTCLFL